MLQVLGLLRDRLARMEARPVSVRLTCGHLPEVANLIGAEPVDFLRRDVLDRGFGLELLHHDVAALDECNQLPLRALISAGARIRLLPRRFPCLAVFGADLGLLDAVVPVRRQPVLVRSAEGVGALRRMHEGLWDLAVDFTALSETTRRMVSSAQRLDVLGKLCAGVKDETAARQTRMSVRTYRRHVASILSTLEVTSRFEAGLQVSELGLAKLLWRDGVVN